MIGERLEAHGAFVWPFDPVSKGGVEATVKIAEADLVPTDASLRADYGSFPELVAA